LNGPAPYRGAGIASLNDGRQPATLEYLKMKKLALAALVASAAIASSAMAQDVTGTVVIKGNVNAKCFVLPGAGSTFGTTVDMEELADSDGTLLDTGVLETKFGSAGGAGLQAQVLCTSANPDVSVTASPLVNGIANDPSVPSGYDNTIDYTADVTFTLVNSGLQTVSDDSAIAASTDTSLTGRLNGTGTNISIATSAWNADGVLVAGDYTGQIVVVVSPGA
jgi:hypothetical protein